MGSALLSSGACLIYSKMYFSTLVDFSEAAGSLKVISGCLLFCMSAVFVAFGLGRIIRNVTAAEFIVNLLISSVSMGLVFIILGSDDPVFKNEDAQLMIDYYKGFLMPMLFFPALAWFTLKPILLKK